MVREEYYPIKCDCRDDLGYLVEPDKVCPICHGKGYYVVRKEESIHQITTKCFIGSQKVSEDTKRVVQI